MTARFGEIVLVALVAGSLVLVFAAFPPLAQDPAYHTFADKRTLLGVPSFANIASNAAFLVVGALGLRLCVRSRLKGARQSWAVFFGAVALIAAGSAYYHWQPSDATLAWDRLPMTLAFMALFAALVAEHARPALERPLLKVALAAGLASVLWWRYTGDLRLYAWVQFAPFLALVYLLAAFPARYTHRGYLALGLAFYAVAKLAEVGDGAVYAATGQALSGHTLKHLLAAGAVFCVYLMLRTRSRSPDAHLIASAQR